MPLYEYRCRTCDTTFELRRSMAQSDAEATCPEGHGAAVRLLSVFAAVGTSNASSTVAPSAPCGGGCACAAS